MTRPRGGDSRFASGVGAVFATAGVAIGLGNIWRFPYMMGRDGGSAFLALYLVIMAAFGVPALMCELALGRLARLGPWGAYRRVGAPGAPVLTWLLILTAGMGASYYAVVIGWVGQESFAMARAAATATTIPPFDSVKGAGAGQFAALVGVVALGCGVLGLGVRRGIERSSAILLPLVFLIFLATLARVLTLPGAIDKLGVFLAPRWGDFTPRTALSALGQSVFSLGLGGTFMVQYGSYLREKQSIPATAIATVGADLAAALLAGAIVVPAVLALGMNLAAGPSLLFDVMPGVFAHMPAGATVGAGFFAAVFFVAMLSLIAAYEVLAGALARGLGLSRGRALLIVFAAECALAIPAYLLSRWIEFNDLLWGTTMQPIGSAIAVVALCWCAGRGRALAELRRSSSLPVPVWLFWWMRVVIPAAILLIVVAGWWDWLSAG